MVALLTSGWLKLQGAAALALFLLALLTSRCHAEEHFVLCSEGNGSFQTQFRTGVAIHVGPSITGDLSTRSCEATLSWGKHTQTVSAGSSQLDLDAFGVDLGLGAPVAAFQVKKSPDDCCMDYLIYSLSDPPRLLRTITGGSFFSAEDTDLDSHVEIWTGDVHASDGIEDLAPSDFDALPTIILRFAHGELLDVGSEFQAFFDDRIRSLQRQLDPEGLRKFKNADGTMRSNGPESRIRLRALKAKVIEITWCYLYSGREEEAWRFLNETWPDSDTEKIRAAIATARSHGMSTQISGVSKRVRSGRQKNAMIFDSVAQFGGRRPEVLPPEPILMQRSALTVATSQGISQPEVNLELVVDSAGKIRSVESTDKVKELDPSLLQAATGWKFIPAFKNDRPVPVRTRIAVSLRQ